MVSYTKKRNKVGLRAFNIPNTKLSFDEEIEYIGVSINSYLT